MELGAPIFWGVGAGQGQDNKGGERAPTRSHDSQGPDPALLHSRWEFYKSHLLSLSLSFLALRQRMLAPVSWLVIRSQSKTVERESILQLPVQVSPAIWSWAVFALGGHERAVRLPWGLGLGFGGMVSVSGLIWVRLPCLWPADAWVRVSEDLLDQPPIYDLSQDCRRVLAFRVQPRNRSNLGISDRET